MPDGYEIESKLLEEFTGNKFPRGFGSPFRRNNFGEYFIPRSVSDVEELIQQFDETNCYITVYSYEEYSQEKRYSSTAIIDTIPLDFDDKMNPANALQDLKTLLRWAKRHDIKPRVQYSGNKGFHMFLDIEPVSLMHPKEALKHFVEDLKTLAGLKTLDTSVNGDFERIIRLPNTKHGTTGRYCIPLDYRLIPYLTIEDVVITAQNKFDFVPVRTPNKDVAEELQRHDQIVHDLIRKREEQRAKQEEMNRNNPLKNLIVRKSCQAYITHINKGALEGSRDFAVCGIIHHCKKAGYSFDETLKMLQAFAQKCTPCVERNLLETRLNHHWKKDYSYCTFFRKFSEECNACTRSS